MNKQRLTRHDIRNADKCMIYAFVCETEEWEVFKRDGDYNQQHISDHSSEEEAEAEAERLNNDRDNEDIKWGIWYDYREK